MPKILAKTVPRQHTGDTITPSNRMGFATPVGNVPAVTDLRGAESEAAELSGMEWDGVKAVVAAVVVVVVVVVSNTRAAKDLVEMYPGCRAIVGSSNAPAAFAALAASAAGVGWGWCGRNAGDA